MDIVLVIIYCSFVALGISDGLLGAGWPSMNAEYLVPLASVGVASMIQAGGKFVSCLFSGRLARTFGEAKVVAVSMAMMAVGLFGVFSIHTFPALVLFSIPYGVGSGFLDVTINGYVAVHYESRFNSWLHCFWSVGSSTGPLIMGWWIARAQGWSFGYLSGAVITLVVAAAVALSMRKWKRHVEVKVNGEVQKVAAEHLPIYKVVKLPGILPILLFAFIYQGIQNTATLWSGSYLVSKGVSEDLAATLASAVFVGLMISRFVNGFLTMKFSDLQLIRMGSVLVGVSAVLVYVLPGSLCVVGLLGVGIGLAPILPCMMHMTAQNADPKYAPSIVNTEMMFVFIGSLVISPAFGLVADAISISLLAPYLLVLLGILVYLRKKAFG